MSATNYSDSTNSLREMVRSFHSIQRDSKRRNVADSKRVGLGEITTMIEELENFTEKDVAGLASRIKRRKHASHEDMFRLSHAFLQSNENIVSFIKIPGALNVIVKELTGSDAKLQIMACETLCNLSLGDAVACEKVAASAGSYLITDLDNSDPRLQVTSLWVIQNILATDGKGYDILLSQEIVPKLLHLYVDNKNPDIDEDILLAIDILQTKDITVFSVQQLASIRDHLLKQKCLSGLHVKILFTSIFSRENPLIEEATIAPIIKIALVSVHETENLVLQDCIRKVLHAIRILGNLVVKFPSCCDFIENECVASLRIELSQLINKIFGWNVKAVNRELVWLIGNVVSCQTRLNKNENILKDLKLSKLTIL